MSNASKATQCVGPMKIERCGPNSKERSFFFFLLVTKREASAKWWKTREEKGNSGI
jgi:hypothetical protein